MRGRHVQPIAGDATGGTTPKSPVDKVTRLQVLHRGQSNAYFADSYGAPRALQDTLAALASLPVDVISRKENTTGDNTIHSGTASYFDNGVSNYDTHWLEAAGNYTSPPARWSPLSPMRETLNAVSRYVSSDRSIPLLDLCLHWEYDLAMFVAEAKAAYHEGYNEITRRIRAARPKDAGKHVRFTAWCPYEGGAWNAIEEIRQAWVANFNDASRFVLPACGNMLDGEKNTQYDPNGDSGHWGDQSGPRIYPRIAFRMAKYAYDQSWLPSNVDLSDCPSMGPRIASAVRSGNSLNLTIAHDKGSALVPGAGGLDWRAFTCSRNEDHEGHFDATGGAITGSNTIRIDFPSALPADGRIWYAAWPHFRARGLIRDDWHDNHPAKYNGVPNMHVVEFPLQRTFAGIPYTDTGSSARGVFFEDFIGGDTGKVSVSDSVCRIGGTSAGAGVMVPATGPSTCFGNGLFEIRARLLGANVGSGSGPALVLWPADDKWTATGVPGFPHGLSREVDIGELTADGKAYVATHHTDCGWGRPDCDAYSAFTINEVILGFDHRDWHTYAADLGTGRIVFRIDGRVVGVELVHPAPDHAHGGVNHSIGFMNRSPETAIECDWVRWTPG